MPDYRQSVIFRLQRLKVLDNDIITPGEKAARLSHLIKRTMMCGM